MFKLLVQKTKQVIKKSKKIVFFQNFKNTPTLQKTSSKQILKLFNSLIINRILIKHFNKTFINIHLKTN